MKSDLSRKSNVSIDMASTKKKKNKVLKPKKSKAKDFVEINKQFSPVNMTLSSEKTNVKSLATDSQLEVNFPRGKNKFNTSVGNTSNSVFKKNREIVNIFDPSTMDQEKEENSGEKNHRNKFNQRRKLSEEQKEEKAKKKREKSKERKLNKKFKTKEEYQQIPSGRALVKARLGLNSMLMNSEDNLKRGPIQDVDKIAADFKKMVSGKGMKSSKLKNSEYEDKLSKKSAVLNKLSKKQRIVDASKSMHCLDNEGNESNRSKAKSPKAADNSTSKPLNSDDKEKRTLFVGNLPITMNKNMLCKLFRKKGFEVESARIRNAVPKKGSIPKKVANITHSYHSNVTSLMGYVVFSSIEEATKGLAMSGTEVDSHHIVVNFACRSFEKQDPTLFLGNLPFDIKDETLFAAFSSYGKIKSFRVIRDRETGIGKGFGYISFENKKSMDDALKTVEVEVEGRKVRLSRCHNRGGKSWQNSGKVKKPRWSSFKSGAIRQKRLEKESSKKSIKKRVKQMKDKQQKKKISSLLDKK